jgi:transcriptional regulator GlxA family with amidase domain
VTLQARQRPVAPLETGPRFREVPVIGDDTALDPDLDDASAAVAAVLSHLVVIAVFDGIDATDVAGPAEVFAMANLLLPSGAPRYEVRIVAEHGGSVPTFSGVRIGIDGTFAELQDTPDTLIVTGRVDATPDGIRVPPVDDTLKRWLADVGPRAGRVAAMCAGAHVAAAAGLLDGHRAATHWATARILAAAHPAVQVDADPIFIRSGRIWTSAGITASIDLALALVSEDHGDDVALRVAQVMVMYLQRPGGQSQFSALVSLPTGTRTELADLRRWIISHLAQDLSVGALARQLGVTPRHVARIFNAELGIAPGEFVEQLRVEHARRLLERTDLPPARVAAESGLGSVGTLHRVFRKRLGITPGQYRQRFGRITL